VAYFKERLTILDGRIVFQGIIQQREIELDTIQAAIWRLGNRGSLRLRSSMDKLTIRFDHYESEERLWLIRHFRSHVSSAIQKNWELFCLNVALPMQEAVLQPGAISGSDEIAITRTRWDWYFLPAIVLSAIFGAIAWLRFQQPHFLVGPLAFTAMWLSLRILTPKSGFPATRISTVPGLAAFALFLLTWLALAMAGIILFRYLPLQPPTNYVVGTLAFVFWMAILLFRAYQQDQKRIAQDNGRVPGALQKWIADNKSLDA
jgi:peptidoglycan/LPS O-acetylase OafA/YrhL